MNTSLRIGNSSLSQLSRGSEWRRWDLHVHTASSYDYDYKATDSDDILVRALKRNEIVAIAITDHFTIDANRIKNIREKAFELRRQKYRILVNKRL
ncbi:MAG: hypothetical protein GX804_08135 [Lentisphaerae bacterium]|jgi:histidinol phosphatase-like PHP family hydrolase|nr:hypothetical protein [Lentisphaerota bacterium]